MNTQQTIAKIAAKNDDFRRSMTGCIVTRGVAAMGPAVNEIFVRVRDFSEFTEDNDPYQEHDFGSFEILGEKILWKIDYYDEARKRWCDPLSDKCQRVLTILLSQEY